MEGVRIGAGSGWFFNLHKSIGLTVAALVLLRAAWRLAHAPAALPTSIPDWQVRAARVSHGLLYASLLLMPLTGFLGASRTQEGLVIFGIALPRFAVADHEMAERFFAIHGTVAWMLVALVMIHIAAALRHLLLKDGVFQRMWP